MASKYLENDSDIGIKWFNLNYLQLNQGECHLLLTGYEFQNSVLRLGDTFLQQSNNEKLLGITIDQKHKFDLHVKNPKSVGKMVGALSRVARALNLDQYNII